MNNCEVHGLLNSDQVYNNGVCKECTRAKRKEYYLANKEKVKARVKRYTVENPEHYENYRKNYRETNLDKIKSSQSEHYRRNRDKIRDRTRTYYNENKDHLSQKSREYRLKNIERDSARSKQYRAKNREELAQKKWEYYQELRKEALLHYSVGSLKCAICSHDVWTHLCLDHIEDGGTKHRLTNKQIKGHAVFNWVKKNNYPAIFQVLCYNCNQIKSLKIPKIMKDKKSRDKVKKEVLSHYSPDLKCRCGFSDIRALTLDHMDGGGRQHLTEIKVKGGSGFYRWVRQEGYPGGLQVLCFNCNCGKNSLRRERGGVVPHDHRMH